jgi:hypothetical protein
LGIYFWRVFLFLVTLVQLFAFLLLPLKNQTKIKSTQSNVLQEHGPQKP